MRGQWFQRAWAKLPDFAVAFLATMLGVLAAFYLDSCHDRGVRRRETHQAISMALLESRGNATLLLHAQKNLKEGINDIPMQNPSTILARAALSNTGLPEQLTWSETYLLRLYVDSIEAWDKLLVTVQDAANDLPINEADREALRLFHTNIAPALVCVEMLQDSLARFQPLPQRGEQAWLDSLSRLINQRAEDIRSGRLELKAIGGRTP